MSETSVTLTCSDHGQQALTSDVTLVVHVLDVNDNAPRFDVTSYSADVVENSLIGTFVTKVRAVDDDDGDNGLVHYILGNAPYSRMSSELDSETAGDGRSREKTRRQKDGNRRYGGDRRRPGRRQHYHATTRQTEYTDIHGNQTEERSPHETEVRRSRATFGGECVGRVNVDEDSGVVAVVGLIDFEYSPVIHCRIQAVDTGSPPKSCTVTQNT